MAHRVTLREIVSQEIRKYDREVATNPHLRPTEQKTTETFIEGMLYALSQIEGHDYVPGIDHFRPILGIADAPIPSSVHYYAADRDVVDGVMMSWTPKSCSCVTPWTHAQLVGA